VFYTVVLAACHRIGTDAVDAITLCLQTAELPVAIRVVSLVSVGSV